MTTLRKTLIGAILAAVVGTAIYEARQASQLRIQVEMLRQQQGPLNKQVRQLQRERDEATNRLASLAFENERLRHNSSELLKLRGEVGMLRRQIAARSTGEGDAQLHAALAEAVSRAEQLSFKQQEREAADFAKEVGRAMRIYTSNNNGRYPTNFDALMAAILKAQYGTNTDGTISYPGGLDLGSLELVNVGLVDENMPDKMVFREKVPRRTPDGQWSRLYGLADGSVQIFHSEDGNFDEREKFMKVPQEISNK